MASNKEKNELNDQQLNQLLKFASSPKPKAGLLSSTNSSDDIDNLSEDTQS